MTSKSLVITFVKNVHCKMTQIGKDDGLLDKIFADEFNILDSRLYKIEICEENYVLIIEVYFKIMRSKHCVKIRFTDVNEYGFYNKSRVLYDVERYKFFKEGSLYYLSLDPYEEINRSDIKDQDFIWSKSIEGFIV